MGTDFLGRDVLSRVIWGTRVSLIFGLCAAGLSLVVGVILGAIAGYYGEWIDDLFSRFFEVFLTIPRVFLVIVIVSLWGSSMYNAILIIGLTMWPTNARIMRAQVLSLKERGFVEATMATGASNFRILFTHIIPNGIYPVISESTLQISYAILLEAGLSFLGLGDPTVVSWGQLLRHAQFHIMREWYTVIFAGLALCILILGFNLLGDGINYALNPRLRERES